jgi:hypothetical protein
VRQIRRLQFHPKINDQGTFLFVAARDEVGLTTPGPLLSAFFC